MLVYILFMNIRRELGLHARTPGAVLRLGSHADARGAVARSSSLSRVLDRGAEAISRGAVPSASHVRDRGTQAVAQAAAWLQVLDRGAQASAQAASCGDATLPHQEKKTQQMKRGTVQILPAACAQRQSNTRGYVPSTRWSFWT